MLKIYSMAMASRTWTPTRGIKFAPVKPILPISISNSPGRGTSDDAEAQDATADQLLFSKMSAMTISSQPRPIQEAQDCMPAEAAADRTSEHVSINGEYFVNPDRSETSPMTDVKMTQEVGEEPCRQVQYPRQFGDPLKMQVLPVQSQNPSGVAEHPEDPLMPVKFRIPESVFRHAIETKDEAVCRWCFTLYKDDLGNTPTAYYCTQPKSFNSVIDKLAHEKVLGFDVEWKAGSQASDPWWHNVSVLQLASQSSIAIFHFANACETYTNEQRKNSVDAKARAEKVKPDSIIPQRLKALLENETIIKAGVNIGGDCTRLSKYCSINVKGSFELSHLYKLVRYSTSGEYQMINRKPVAMAVQVKEQLLLPIAKDNVRVSDWTTKRLNTQQIEYAASDAYAGLMLFHEMERRRRDLSPTPPRPAFDERKAPIAFVIPQKLYKIKDEAPVESKGPGNNETHETLKPKSETVQEAVCEDVATLELLRKAAQEFAKAWYAKKQSQQQKPVNKVQPASLKAYFLWHVRSLHIDKVCETLRDPPLQKTTVAKYISTAVKNGALTHDRRRYNTEVVPHLAAFWQYSI